MATVEDILLSKGSGVIAAAPDTTVREAARRMAEADVGSLIIEQAPDILGIFTERDLLRRVVAAGRNPDTTFVRDVMSSPVKSCSPRDDVRGVAARLGRERLRHLAVVDAGEVVGLLSLRDLLAAELAEAGSPVA